MSDEANRPSREERLAASPIFQMLTRTRINQMMDQQGVLDVPERVAVEDILLDRGEAHWYMDEAQGEVFMEKMWEHLFEIPSDSQEDRERLMSAVRTIETEWQTKCIEQFSGPIFEKFSQALDYLNKAKGIEKMRTFFERHQVKQIIDPSKLVSSATQFDMEADWLRKSVDPAIFFNAKRMEELSVEEIAADFLRTGSLMIQARSKGGYERRWSVSMRQAIWEQRQLLEVNTNLFPSHILFDPRDFRGDEAEAELVKMLIGPIHFYMDIGFEDWKESADRLKELMPFGNPARRTLSKIKTREDLFTIAREIYCPQLYTRGMFEGGWSFFESTETEERVRKIADALVGQVVGTAPIDLSN